MGYLYQSLSSFSIRFSFQVSYSIFSNDIISVVAWNGRYLRGPNVVHFKRRMCNYPRGLLIAGCGGQYGHEFGIGSYDAS